MVSTNNVGFALICGDNNSFDTNRQEVGGANDDSTNSCHQQDTGGDKCNSIPVRETNSIFCGDYHTLIMIQFSNCRAEEVPMSEGFLN